MSQPLTDAITALIAALGGGDATHAGDAGADARDHAIAALPVERALAIALYLARCDAGAANDAARAVAARIYAALTPVAFESMRITDDLARIALALDIPADAVALLTDRLARSESLSALQLLARGYIAQGDREHAQALAARLRNGSDMRITIWLILGELALAFETPTASAEAYQHALDLAPNGGSAILGLARCRAVQGDATRARELLARNMAAYGETPSAWVLRETLGIVALLGASDQDSDEIGAWRTRLAEIEAGEATSLRLSITPDAASGAQNAPTRPRRRAVGALPIATARAQAIGHVPIAASNTDADDDDDRDDLDAAAASSAASQVIEEEPASPELLDALRETFGYESFLPGQATIIGAALAGEDLLALMPTGAGKSLCYQLPALLLPGTTVLISPLIALMKDQLDGLPAAARAQTTIINSLVERDELAQRLAAIAAGKYKLVYAAPERLRQQSFIYALRRAGVARFVIDEAHCVSLWGHDFRPDYLFIAKALRQLEADGARIPVLALTATATPEVRAGIAEALGRDLRIVNRGVFRGNLRYEALPAYNDDERLRAVAQIVTETPGSGIIYVRSRDGCEKVAEFLRRRCHVNAIHYHAGMERDERERAQDDFISGRARVVAATVAFGMGIDKPDVRFIVHYQLPSSLEAYVQESGRAGRDGQPSRCVLFVSPGDVSALRRHVRQDELSIETLRAVYAAARNLVRASAPASASLGRVTAGELETSIATAFQASGRAVDDTSSRVALSLLERAGFLLRHPDVPRSPAVRLTGSAPSPADPRAAAFSAFVAAANLRPGEMPALDLVALSARLATTPAALEEQVLGWRDAGLLDYRDSGRDYLLEICPPPPDGKTALPALLASLVERHERHVSDLVGYTRVATCRQRRIARHFGERLPVARCGVCDRCQGSASGASGETGRATRRERREHLPRIRDDAVIREAILACLRDLPYAVGVTGLVKILRGSADTGATATRSPQFGALAGVGVSRISKIILAMVMDGVLERDDAAEYPTLRIHGEP
ncbi:MAG: ATP-dependent DNA helicase RecQ [Ktedonobacterales bacterium]|jgi:ATP-dependent DNA helicase RecQ|nr:MAG: ATP-dependent DNA helicase RecQ [Ktedonobacterales bacterium]